MNKLKKVTMPKIIATVMLVAIFFGISFSLWGGGAKNSIGDTSSYLKENGIFMGVVTIGGNQLQISQYDSTSNTYLDCKEYGINLGTDRLATDVTYNNFGNIIVQNTDVGTSIPCYVRWKFVAIIDGKEENINKYCIVNENENIFWSRQDNGEYYYYVDEEYNSKSLESQEFINLLNGLEFKGKYTGEEYGSILDNYYSGSTIELKVNVETKETPWTIEKPTAKFYVNGNLIHETLEFTNEITIPRATNSETVYVENQTTGEIETLYFQFYTRNGSGLYLPGDEIIIEPYDVFEAIYSTEPEAYTATNTLYSRNEDGSYAVNAINPNSIPADGNLVLTDFSEEKEITIISDNAFKGVKTITTVDASDSSITAIGANAFQNCTNLQTISLPETVTTIGNNAFRNCSSLQEIVFSENVDSLGQYSFYGCTDLESVVIPGSVTSIGVYAFSYCTSLKSVVFNEGVVEIEGSFTNCDNLEYVYIPSTITSAETAFTNCPKLTTFEIDPSNQIFASTGPILYDKTTMTLRFFPSASGEVRIDDMFVSLGSNCFKDNTNLTKLVINKNVVSIHYTALDGCSNLTSIVVEEGNAYYSSDGEMLCRGGVIVAYPGAVGDITISDSVTEIGALAFNKANLTSVTLSDNVVTIGLQAFYNASNLVQFTAGTGLTKISYRGLPYTDCNIVLPIKTGWYMSGTGFSNGTPVDDMVAIAYGEGITFEDLTPEQVGKFFKTNRNYYFYRVTE